MHDLEMFVSTSPGYAHPIWEVEMGELVREIVLQSKEQGMVFKQKYDLRKSKSFVFVSILIMVCVVIWATVYLA